MKYHKGDILRYPGNGITWKVKEVRSDSLLVVLVDRGTSNYPMKIGEVDIYSMKDWHKFKVISFNSYLRLL